MGSSVSCRDESTTRLVVLGMNNVFAFRPNGCSHIIWHFLAREYKANSGQFFELQKGEQSLGSSVSCRDESTTKLGIMGMNNVFAFRPNGCDNENALL